jgi:3-hydroxybutyryl-CoA dehydrogenase
MDIKTVAVVGAGVMGCDIALDLAASGFDVILKDLTDTSLQKARAAVQKNFKLYKLVKADRFTLTLEDYLERIHFTTEYTRFPQADLVIENITEDREAKRRLYRELAAVCRPDVLYGINTSCISITHLASLLPHPDRVIGLHFLNPVPLKGLVEVIRGFHTSEETLSRAQAFLKTMGKAWIVVNDMPGFVTNRVLMLTINECIWLIQDRVAAAGDIDAIFKRGFGHKMGPLATADLIGLDTILNSLLVLCESYNDPKYRPCPLLRKMVDAGTLGKKTGRGFFEYR